MRRIKTATADSKSSDAAADSSKGDSGVTELQRRISDIIERRREALPDVRVGIANAAELDGCAGKIRSALEQIALRDEDGEMVRLMLGEAVAALAQHTAAVREELGRVERRFSRSSVSIGVSGQARMGKSTLLRTISGLSDNEIPTGAGDPVTAVQSQIYATETETTARVDFHDEQTFLTEVVGPYAQELGLEAPGSIESLATWRVPALDDVGAQHLATLRARLVQIRDAVSSFKGDLSGATGQVVPLERLRSYVAYPADPESTDRPYLAVRRVRISAPFPRSNVRGLGLIDLPGLGEIAAGAEARHLDGLRDSVDYVVMVKRADANSNAMWHQNDSAAISLVDKALSGVSARFDHLGYLINTAKDDDQALIGNLRRAVDGQADGSSPAGRFSVFEADAGDSRSVDEQLIIPVLLHLAERLPQTDAALVAGSRSRLRESRERAIETLKSLMDSVSASVSVDGSVRTVVNQRADRIHSDIALALRDLIAELQSEAHDESTIDQGYVAAVNRASQVTMQWAEAGLGRGSREAWLEWATRKMVKAGSSAGLLETAMNEISVEVASHNRVVGDFVNGSQIPLLLDRVVSALRPAFGGMASHLEGANSREVLLGLAVSFEMAEQPLASMARALRELADVTVPFGSMLYPIIRAECDACFNPVPPSEGQDSPVFAVEPDEAGAEQMYHRLQALVRQAVHQIRKELLAQSEDVSRVMLSIVRLFDDSIIRFAGADEQFRTMAHGFRDEIWPGEFDKLSEQNVRVRTSRKAIADALVLLNEEMA